MNDRRSAARVTAMTCVLDRRFRGCRACRGLAARGGRPAAERRHRPGGGGARQPRAAGARGPGRDPPVPHGPRCRPDARAAAAGAGAVARHRPAALASRAAPARRRHPRRATGTASRRWSTSPSRARRSPPTSTSPRVSTGPRRPSCSTPATGGPTARPARTSRPSASTWPGSASSCSASTPSARGSGASRRATTAAPRRCWWGSPSRGSPSMRPAARWSTCSPGAEVDPRRVGITGASGGGYNTWITAALDDRIAAAVPVVGTSEFAEQIHVCRPLDWYHAAEHCHFVPGLIRYANNHELLAMAAPKPVLIIAASQDQSFPLAGVREVADYGRDALRVVRRRGQDRPGGGRARRGTATSGSSARRRTGGSSAGCRNAVTADRTRSPPPRPCPSTAEELRCFPAGRNEPAGPAMIEAVRRLARDLPPSPPRIDLEAVLGPTPSAPPARVKVSGARLQRLLIPSEAGLDVPAFLLRPAGEVRGLRRRPRRPREGGAGLGPGRPGGPRPGLGGLRRGPPGHRRIGHRQDRLGVRRQPPAGGELRRPPGLGHRPGARSPRAPGAFPGKPVGLYARGQNACLAATYAIARASDARSRPRCGGISSVTGS